jgi:hypothetical protein
VRTCWRHTSSNSRWAVNCACVIGGNKVRDRALRRGYVQRWRHGCR